jgi:threonine/homoserine/homoserine lactone efflux protein
MDLSTMLLFSATVLPLICTPGPDMLFITSQAVSRDALAGLRATAGVCVGYVVHSLLVVLGLAAIIAASPMLFEGLRWLGVVYLVYLACQLIRSAMKAGKFSAPSAASRTQFKRGFLTAVLNPKGMMIYFAILSAIFIGLCGVVYTVLSFVIASTGKTANSNHRRRRWIEGASGGLLVIAAGKLATS